MFEWSKRRHLEFGLSANLISPDNRHRILNAEAGQKIAQLLSRGSAPLDRYSGGVNGCRDHVILFFSERAARQA